MVTDGAAPTPVGRWAARHFVAGDPALELANTVSHRRDPALAEDRIASARDLADWARSLGLDAGVAPVAGMDVARVAAIRETVHRIFAAVAEAREPPRRTVAALLRTAASGFAGRGELPRLDARLAWLAVRTLATAREQRIGACPACGWLFLDASRSGRRRWCAMATCGTTAKVRAFRQRRAGAA